MFWIRITDGLTEGIEEDLGVWKRSVRGGGLEKPWIFVGDLFNPGLDGEFDVVLGLVDVDAVEEGDETKGLERKIKFVVDHIEEHLAGNGGWGSTSKIVTLPHEENTFIVDDTRVEAGFMGGGSETKGT
jgi:hypothetical protein